MFFHFILNVKSNSAAKDISLLTYDLDKQNIKRESFELKSFQKSIQQNVYHHKGLSLFLSFQ